MSRGSKTKPAPVVEEEDDEDIWAAPVVVKKASKEAPVGEASRLARKYHLDLYEVKYILKLFCEADDNDSGGLDKDEFKTVLKGVFDVPAGQDVPEALLNGAWNKLLGASDGRLEANADAFLEWYTANMFTAAVTEVQQSASEAQSSQLSKKHGIDQLALDKIKKRFDEFDVDGSGQIDHDEFVKMLVYVLKAHSADDISKDRTERFWKEIDIDGSGEIDFSEFVEWFVKYFNPDDDEMDLNDKGPVGQFYNSFNPTVARKQSKGSQED